MVHIPVLLQEVIAAINPKSGGYYLDCTLGDGGHAQAILKASEPDGKLVGIDTDSHQVAVARQRLERFKDRVWLVRSPFSQIDSVVKQLAIASFDGILFDLGYSSRQLSNLDYGLSFDDASPLDMRLSSSQNTTAADWLNRANEVTIADALFRYGNRHASRMLAHKVMAYRQKKQFRDAKDLKEALGMHRPGDLAPIWQAIRIIVNHEYDEIESGIPKAFGLLRSGGVLAVITFHSGEDRLVKNLFRTFKEEWAQKPQLVSPRFEEIKLNSRSRSAKLRVVVKK